MLTIESAYNYIKKDYKETLVFCALAAIVVFIPVFGALLIMGLSIKVISNAINKKEEIPKFFGNMGQDLMNGLKYLGFMILIMSPFVLILSGSMFGLIASATSEDYSNMVSVISNMGTGLILFLFLIVAYVLIIPALTAIYAKSEKFGDFFKINEAFSLVFGNFGSYLKLIGINILYIIVFSIISGVLSFTIVVPFLLSPVTILISNKNLGEWFKDVSKK